LNIRRTSSSLASGTIIISSNREWCKKASTLVGAFLRLKFENEHGGSGESYNSLDARADFVLLDRCAAIKARAGRAITAGREITEITTINSLGARADCVLLDRCAAIKARAGRAITTITEIEAGRAIIAVQAVGA